MNRGHSILLVEDNPDAVELTLRAFRKSKVLNEIVTVIDGIEALDYQFATGVMIWVPTASCVSRWISRSSWKQHGNWVCTGW
jgi:hypothetical protein